MKTTDVVLVDAGGTNIGSVRYALQRLGVEAELSDDAARIRAATHVILPGVGAAAPGMQRLHQAGLVGVLRELRQPLLGVCLGMQLLFEHSAEGMLLETVSGIKTIDEVIPDAFGPRTLIEYAAEDGK